MSRLTDASFAVCIVAFAMIALGGEAADEAAQPVALTSEPASTESPSRQYVGIKRCRMCHTKWYESWLESSKANAFESLKPNAGAAIKKRAGLDVTKDYTADSRCLRCHSVGFGKPGGYVTPTPGDKTAERHARLREGVGCEACHGPGSDYIQVMRDILLEERPYRQRELLARGRQVVGEAVCLSCHNQNAVCMKQGEDDSRALSYEFKVDLDNSAGFHKRFELQYRVGE